MRIQRAPTARPVRRSRSPVRGRSAAPWARAAACLALAFGLTGCQILPEAQPDPTRYFLLSSPQPVADDTPSGVSVGLRPVELPGYLRNSRSLVVARGPNELSFRDYDRWAEPLEAGLVRVLREALTQQPQVAQVYLSPAGAGPRRDFDVAVRVLHCEGTDRPDGNKTVRFAIAYEIYRATPAGELVKQGTFTAREAAWDGEAAQFAALVAAAAAEAGQAIAADLPAANG